MQKRKMWVKKRKTRSSHESILTRKLALSILSDLIDLASVYFHTFRTQFRLLLGFVSRAGGFKFLARVKLDLQDLI